ncbi:hypothetical protein ILUMI_16552 [Ignelater luminosus]|uniref:PiggyBac transposable element-derived protein domain-containing protein n=1 Tax=Ignelater luminosus TaxID=2038154 RepID=A0A8K0G8F5_IGNLU|nr:hypothetical protein ILUMI_16552 [Ignelater luminosus]
MPMTPNEDFKLSLEDPTDESDQEEPDNEIQSEHDTESEQETLLIPTFVKNTDLLEIKAFLGLLYLQGIYKFEHEDMRSLWATKGRGRPIFRATMSLARFSFLLACLRFHDLDTRIERSKTNKLVAISKIFQKFVENCKACYCPGAYVTVNEMLISFRGRCSFKMYMPNKPAKYGIKVQILADAKTHYMCMAETYAGAEVGSKNKENFKLANPTGVMLRLAAPIIGTNRNITADNWYSSVELVEELRKHNITYIGTLKEK